jgi:hypothetical protein
MNTRRKFLFDCSAAVATLALAPITSIGASSTTNSGSWPIEQIRHAAFAGQINTIFRAQLPSGQIVKLKLLKAPLAQPVRLSGSRLPADAENEKFSLIFSGPKDFPLASAIHQFEHNELGRFEMHVGEIGQRDETDIRYEAVFNQCVPTALT